MVQAPQICYRKQLESNNHSRLSTDCTLKFEQLQVSMNASSNSGTASVSQILYLVGAGVLFPNHITLQTLEILNSCKRVYTNIQESNLAGLPSEIRSKCVTLWPMYQDGRLRRENYSDVSKYILSAAELESPIAWLTPGHPVVFDSVTQLLLAGGRERGWNIPIIPGISCVDTILAEVGYDPASGLLIHDTTSLVNMDFPLTPSIALLLLQPSTFNTDRSHFTTKTSAPNLAPLGDYFLRAYPPDHLCAFVRSATTEGPAQVLWTDVAKLSTVPFLSVAGTSLFVPALSREQRISALNLGVKASRSD